MFYEVVVMERTSGFQVQRSDPHRWESVEEVYFDYVEEYGFVNHEIFIELCEV